MKSEELARRKTAALMMKSLRSPHRRKQLSDLGHESGKPILVVLETDTLGEVLGRIVDERVATPAILAMYRETAHTMVVWSFRRAESKLTKKAAAQAASTAASIGLLFEIMQAEGIDSIDLELNCATAPASLRADELVDA